ncbi:hypothetical protein CC78DRAFT_580569 [Lojkania enalia]|uniref:Uncharacterized protein n=1 Tax=Lojkania enalia TaxID=147567 RepID=A0A9P4N433_9PLEO|nr:hypothetical protein CC78DRAFT_580569 [Didymosphaeria enalia]
MLPHFFPQLANVTKLTISVANISLLLHPFYQLVTLEYYLRDGRMARSNMPEMLAHLHPLLHSLKHLPWLMFSCSYTELAHRNFFNWIPSMLNALQRLYIKIADIRITTCAFSPLNLLPGALEALKLDFQAEDDGGNGSVLTNIEPVGSPRRFRVLRKLEIVQQTLIQRGYGGDGHPAAVLLSGI